MGCVQWFPILLLVAGFGGYMGFSYLSRHLQTRAFLPLDDETKKRIFEAFAPFRKYNLVPAALILVLYIVSVRGKWLPIVATNVIFALLYLFYLISTLFFIYFSLKKMGIEKKVNRNVVIALAMQYLGMIFILVILIVYFLLRSFSLCPAL